MLFSAAISVPALWVFSDPIKPHDRNQLSLAIIYSVVIYEEEEEAAKSYNNVLEQSLDYREEEKSMKLY